MSNTPKDIMIYLSSWNYGSYSITNPFYNKMNLKSQPIKYIKMNIPLNVIITIKKMKKLLKIYILKI